jgi:DNA polymerase IIIc chi subunit
MGHGKTGVMRRKLTNVSIELVEVPMKEGERRLGIRGWKNSTWQRYDETMARLREIIEELYQEKGRKITAREIYEQYVKEGWHLRKRNQAKLTQEKKE